MSEEGTTNTREVQGTTRDDYETGYVNKLNLLEETGKFLEMYNLPKVNQENRKFEQN